mgnify:FL=1
MKFVDRVEWRARPPRSRFRPLVSQRVQGIVVHHSGVRNGPSGVSAVRSFERYHMDTKGWDGIAYNWLVDASGTIFEGRGAKVRAAATKDWNSKSESVCFIGWGFEPVSDAALVSIKAVIDDVQSRYGGKLWVKGHRDLSASTCPGDWLYDWLTSGAEEPVGDPSKIDYESIVAYLRALEGEVRGKPLSRLRRSRGEAVRVAQRHLSARGYAPGVADGIYGRRTAAAVSKFQSDQGWLKANGVIDWQTWSALFGA